MKHLTFVIIIFALASNSYFPFAQTPVNTGKDPRLPHVDAGIPFTLDDRDRLVRVEEKIESINKRIDDLNNLIYVVLAGIFVLIGFVIWDRRTAITPVSRDTKRIKEALNELAEKNPELKEILKRVAL